MGRSERRSLYRFFIPGSLPHPLRGSLLSERAFYTILPNLRNPSLQRPLFGLYYYYVVLCQPDKTEG